MFEKLTWCYLLIVAAQYDIQAGAVGLQEMIAGRQFALHLLNIWQNDSRVSI